MIDPRISWVSAASSERVVTSRTYAARIRILERRRLRVEKAGGVTRLERPEEPPDPLKNRVIPTARLLDVRDPFGFVAVDRGLEDP